MKLIVLENKYEYSTDYYISTEGVEFLRNKLREFESKYQEE